MVYFSAGEFTNILTQLELKFKKQILILLLSTVVGLKMHENKIKLLCTFNYHAGFEIPQHSKIEK